jgi:hypothetical protein
MISGSGDVNGGHISISAGDAHHGVSGSVLVNSGFGGIQSGDVNLSTGNSVNSSGSIQLTVGNSRNQVGSISMSTPIGKYGGNMLFNSGGNLTIHSASLNNSFGEVSSGSLLIASGNSSSGRSGDISIGTGASRKGKAGSITLSVGTSFSKVGGNITLTAGETFASKGSGGSVYLSGGEN